MADTLSNTSILDNLLPVYFSRKALPRLIPKVTLYQFAEKTPLPKGEGKQVTWNGWSNFAAVSASLTEGTNPSMAGLSSRKVTATIAQYGRGAKTTDLIEYTASLDVIQGTVDNLTDSAAISVDKVIQLGLLKSTLAGNANGTILSAWMSAVVSAFHGGTNTAQSNLTWQFPVVMGTTATRLSAVNKAAPSVSARMSLYAIKKTVNQLRDNNAMEYPDGYFKCVMNTKSMADLRTDPDFKAWFQSLDNESVKKGIVAQIEGCQIYTSNNLPKYRVTAHSCNVSFVFGQGAYGVVDIASGGRGFEIIIKRPGQNSTDNPLNMFATLSYKFTMVAKALNVSAGRTLFTHSKP